MGRRSRPYFCGVDRTLNFQQKEALTQGILQIFETIPEEFESFKFHFSGNQVYIYKLDHEMILLVVTQADLIYTDYLKTIKNLKATLREDIANAIATFRTIAGATNLPGVTSTTRTTVTSASVSTVREEKQLAQPNLASLSTTALPTTVRLIEAIAALNHLSQFTTQYLGTYVIANYWKSTRPAQDWLNQLQVDRNARISLLNATPQQLQAFLTPEQKMWLQAWVAEFIKRCTQVIRDFPALIEQKALTHEQKALLLG